MKKSEILVSAVALAFFMFMLSQTFELMEVRRFGEMGSGFWPLLTLGVSSLLALMLLISNIRQIKSTAGQTALEPSPEAKAATRDARKKVALSMACLLIYLVAIPWIGFILATCLFVLAFALGLQERRKTVLIISPILVTGIVVAIFAKFITIAFPKGVGIFAAFSRLFY
ncbi:MAG: tripartite tricarboxylate transporter TctB family protein [Thermodesulfobacteriota bacterium]